MLDRLLRIEEQFARVEALLLVVFVLLMLSLATYNVFYGNVLVPIQVSLLTDDTPSPSESDSTPTVAPAGEKVTEPAEAEAEAEGADDAEGFGGGFGGGFGDPPPEADGFGGDFGDPEGTTETPEPAEKPAADDSAGFGGDFGGEGDAPADTAEDTKPAPDDSGFGGDFPTDDAKPADSAGGFGGGFGGDFDETTPTEPEPAAEATSEPEAPREMPFIARAIDAVKLEWIDVLLRQLVLIVGFLGAMLATRRRKHITIDALSKLLPKAALHWVAVLTNSISIVVCVLLAKAGSDLVAISLEYPKELTTWADEWQFQLAFPIGFGMLVFHFSIRLVESVLYATKRAEPPADYDSAGGMA